MTKLDGKSLTAGILAGLCAALLALGASFQLSLASVLYAASALPVLVVALSRGNAASIVAIVTAALVAAIAIAPMAAVGMAIFTLLPAGWLGHLASLARPASEIGGPSEQMAWYPLSDIMMHLCGAVTIGVVVLGVMIGYGPDFIDQMMTALTDAAALSQPELSADAATLSQFKDQLLVMLPAGQGATWVMLLTAAYYFAVRIVATTGTVTRPRESMPTSLRMNRQSLIVFVAGIVAAFFDGPLGLVGATMCGTFGAGFLISGFASIHARTMGKEWRLPALIIVYLSVLFVIPLALILALGLADTRRTVALTPLRKDGSKKNDSNPDIENER